MTSFVSEIPGDLKQTLTLSEVDVLSALFAEHSDGKVIKKPAIATVAKKLGEQFGASKNFMDVFSSYASKKEAMPAADFVRSYVEAQKESKVMKQTGVTQDSLHSFSDEEKRGYVEYVNRTLSNDMHVADQMPIDPATMHLFEVLGRSIVLGRLVNKGFPEALPMAELILKPKNNFQVIENHNKTLASAKKIGCRIVNVSAEDLVAGTAHLVMGVLWQVIRANLLKEVQDAARESMGADAFPENLPPEQLITKWVNARLKAVQCKRELTNFAGDLDDGEIYAHLLHSCEPNVVTRILMSDSLKEKDKLTRVEQVLGLADKIGCRKFVTAAEVVKGNPRLNLAFLATLFKAYPHMLGNDSAKVAEVERALAAAEARLAAALQEAKNMQTRAQSVSSERDAIADKLASLSSQLAEALSAKDLLSKQAADHAAALEKLKSQLSTQGRASAELEAQMEEMAASLSRERSERQTSESALAALRAAMQKQTDDHAAMLAKLTASAQAEADARRKAESERDALLSDLTRAKEDFLTKEAALKDKLEDLRAKMEADARRNENAIRELQDAKSALAAALKSAEDESKKLREAMANKEKEYQTALSSLQASKDKMEAELMAAVAKERGEKEAAKVEGERARAEVERVRREAAEREAQMRTEMDTMTRRHQEKEKDYEKLISTLRARIAELEAEVAALKRELEKWKNMYDDLKRELTRQLEDERAAHAAVKAALAEERAARELIEDELHDTQEELEEVREEAEDEKLLLLQRIKDLEEELTLLKGVMENSLDKAARERAEALAAAAAAKKKALEEAERQRLEELRKVRGVMAAVSCDGYLLKQSGGFRGAWNKRYFVLQSNILTWYRNEKEFKEMKPKGLLKVEEVRIYEIGDKRQFAFSLENINDANVKNNLAGMNLEDMKKWVNAIKEAKKKFIAQKVVVEDKAGTGGK